MANFEKLAKKQEPVAKESNMERRDRELKELGTGEAPKKKGETMLEYEKRMRALEKQEK